MPVPVHEDLGELSPTVVGVLDATPTEVTAAELARDVLSRHPEYGDRGAAHYRAGSGPADRRERGAWVADVRALFDRAAAPVLHGRLLVIGLARLNPALRAALDADGLYSAVADELREPLDTLWTTAPTAGAQDDWQVLSPSARQAFAHAAALSGGGTVHTEQLLRGLYAKPDGPTRAFLDDLGVTRARLDAALAGAVEAHTAELSGPVAPLRALPRLSSHVRRAVDHARAFAADLGSTTVRSRHLFSGLLAVEGCDVTRALADLGATADAFRRSLARPEPPVGGAPLAGGISHDVVDPELGIPREQDDLAVSTYVAMMAAAVARRETRLPLSIGLFGEWGSGKSYFMGLLREQVAELAERGKQGDRAYCPGIVQIGFNAWSYADANLWASLGDEIFRDLAGPAGTEQDAADGERRTQLRTWLADEQDRVKELEAARSAAAEEVAKLRAEVDRREQDRLASAGTLLRATVEAVRNDPVRSAELRGAWAGLGLADDAEKARVLADTVTGSGNALDALRRSTARGTGRYLLAALLAAGAVFVVVGLASSGVLAAWFTGGGLAAVLTAAVTGAAMARRVSAAVRSITGLADEIRYRTESGSSAPVQAAAHQVRTAEAREQVLRAQLDQVVVRVGELGRELAELSPGQRLYTFLAERAASEDYRSRQGLIAMIRRDFERLSALQKQWRDGGDGSPRPIDRIVLYIDDLDRCTPRQVVEVLQAVHLLLALDLFVVVVGVDPRWLLHALRDQYRSTLTAPEGPEETLREDADRMMLGTPRDYLQKIFNVPFVLPAMTATGFETMLRRLSKPAGPDEQAGPRHRTPADHGPLPPVDPAAHPVGTVAHGAPPVAEGSEVAAIEAGATVKSVGLTEPELRMLSTLAPLVRSPREAKRLLNLYRMLRSTQDLSDASRFLGKDDGGAAEFEAVALLLGVLTAGPHLLGRLLFTPPDPGRAVAGGLCQRTDAPSWAAFITGLRPREKGSGAWCNDVDDALSEADRAEWTLLVDRAAPASALVTLVDLSAFVTWAPHVARFSFLLAPVGGPGQVQRLPSGAFVASMR